MYSYHFFFRSSYNVLQLDKNRDSVTNSSLKNRTIHVLNIQILRNRNFPAL